MKKILLLLLSGIAVFPLFAQEVIDSTSVDQLNAPSNPAFNLMGISPSTIDRPTDLSAFRLSIQNASTSFTKIPSNYAVEFSPAALFSVKNQTLQKFNSTKPKDYLWQTLSLSIGITQSNLADKETGDSTSYTKLGFGLKVSLIRPKWNDSTSVYVNRLYAMQAEELKKYESSVDSVYKNDPVLHQLELSLKQANGNADSINARVKRLGDYRQSLVKKLFVAVNTVRIKEQASKLKISRSGCFLDFATGLALDFPDTRFNNSMVSKAGAWLTGGYESGASGLSILGIARYLFQPDKIFADATGKLGSKNISTFDAGARLAFTGLEGKFTAGAEALYRSVLNKNTIDPSWRLVFNAEYSVGKNQKITLALGRNFDGTITKSGNLIAALNFIRGFGNNKKITAPSPAQ